MYYTYIEFPFSTSFYISNAVPRNTPTSALLLTGTRSLLALTEIFNADRFEMALFWQMLSNEIESEGQYMRWRKKEQGALSFARCTYGWLMQTSAVHYQQEQITTMLQERERRPGPTCALQETVDNSRSFH